MSHARTRVHIIIYVRPRMRKYISSSVASFDVRRHHGASKRAGHASSRDTPSRWNILRKAVPEHASVNGMSFDALLFILLPLTAALHSDAKPYAIRKVT